MSKYEMEILRFQNISKLRQEEPPEDAIEFLVRNTNHEYKMILACDLVNFYPKSENVLLFLESLIFSNLDLNYSKSENLNWIQKISQHMSKLEALETKKLVTLMNERMRKKPLITREIVLMIMREFAGKNELEKLDVFLSDLKSNFLDKRHRYLITKKYKEHGALIVAYETVEKIEHSAKKKNLKNDILIEIAEYLCKESSIREEEIIRGSKHGTGGLDDFLDKVMREHSEVYSFEYNKIVDEGRRKKISPELVIKSLSKSVDFEASDLFINQDMNTKDIQEKLTECKTISVPGIVSKVANDEVEFSELCQNLIGILENIELNRSNIILMSILQYRSAIPVEHVEKIVNYVKKESSKLDNLVLLRTAKLTEKINRINDGIFLLNKLTSKSALKLKQELEEKGELLKNGYDIDKIINEYSNFPAYSSKNKILYFTHSDLPYVTSGYTVRTDSIVNSFTRHGFDVETLSRWGFPLDRDLNHYHGDIVDQFIDTNGIKHNFDPSHEGMKSHQGKEYISQAVQSMIKKCEIIKPSVIISASDHVTGTIALISSKILGIPFIYEMRGLWAYTRATNYPGYDKSLDFALRLRFERQCALEADRVVVISEALRELVVDWGVTEEKIHSLPNGVEKTVQRPNHTEIDRRNVKLGYIGSIVPYEGLNTTIEAIQVMKRDKTITPKLIVVGDGISKNELDKIVAENGLEENVELRGRIPHKDVDSFYEEVDAIILPRLSTKVTDIIPPLKPLEAIAKGKIVISSRINTHNELFDNIGGSIQFEQGNVLSQISAIREFLSSADEHSNMISEAFDYVENNRNYQQLTKKIATEIVTLQLNRLQGEEYELDDIRDIVSLISHFDEEVDSEKSLVLTGEEIIDFIESFQGDLKRDLYLVMIRKLGKDWPEFCLEIAKEMQLEINDERAMISLVRSANRSGLYEFANVLHASNNRVVKEDVEVELDRFWKTKGLNHLESRGEILLIETESGIEDLDNKGHSPGKNIILMFRALKRKINEGELNQYSGLITQIMYRCRDIEYERYAILLEWIAIFVQNNEIGSDIMRVLVDDGRYELASMIYNPKEVYDLTNEQRKVMLENVEANKRNQKKIKEMRTEFNQLVKQFRGGERDTVSDEIIKLGNKLILNDSMSLTPLTHISNAHVHNGNLSSAINLLRDSKWRNHTRVIEKIRNYESQLDWLSKGFDTNSSLETARYKPVKGRIMYTLHNSLPFNTGGYATRSHGIAVGLKNLGWDVHVVTRMGYPHDRRGIDTSNFESEETIDGVTYHRIYSEDIGFGRTILANYLEYYKIELQKLALRIKPEIIHAASNYWNGLVAIGVAHSLKVPSVYEVRGLWEVTRASRQIGWDDSEVYQIMERLETQAVTEATGTLALTEAIKMEFARRGATRNDIQILPNGVNITLFTPKKRYLSLLSRINIEPDKIVIGYIGSVVSYEGLDLLMEACRKLKEDIGSIFKILIVGDGAYLPEVIKACDDNDMQQETIFTGRIPHDEVSTYYSIIDIAPFPRLSLPVTEMVSPLKPFEAMAMRKAVLCSDVDAMSEFIDWGKNGLTFTKNDSEDLKNKLKMLILDRKMREDIGKRARKWAIKNRDWGEISKTLSKEYKRILR